MYRIVGCILVVAAGAGLGVSESIRVSERIYTLEMLLRMVICLKGEIRCGNASLPDAFYGAAGRMNGKYREFLITAADRMKAGKGEKLSQICCAFYMLILCFVQAYQTHRRRKTLQALCQARRK